MLKFLMKRAGFLLILSLPFWNGYRLDIDRNQLFLFRYELGYSMGYLFFLFTLLVIVGFLGLSMVWYRTFCNWGCPHNAVSSILNRIERKLGKPVTFVISLAASLLMSYSTVSFFYDPVTIAKSLIGFEMNKYFWLAASLTGIYTVLTFKARSSFCKVCPYGIAQQVAFIDPKKGTDWLTHPGVWITWGTSFALLAFLVIGW